MALLNFALTLSVSSNHIICHTTCPRHLTPSCPHSSNRVASSWLPKRSFLPSPSPATAVTTTQHGFMSLQSQDDTPSQAQGNTSNTEQQNQIASSASASPTAASPTTESAPAVPSFDLNMDMEKRKALVTRLNDLNKKLEKAIRLEKFSDAAAYKKEILHVKMKEPYIRAKMELEQAVKEQRFKDATTWKNRLRRLGKTPGYVDQDQEKKSTTPGDSANTGNKLKSVNPSSSSNPPKKDVQSAAASAFGAVQKKFNQNRQQGPDTGEGVDVIAGLDPKLVNPSSTANTNGIIVDVVAQFSPTQSDMEKNYFVFSYNVTIKNNSLDTIQIISRQWNIHSLGSKKINKITGSGVVGKQPVLAPGEVFEYQSLCPIMAERTGTQKDLVMGSMTGHYIGVSGDVGQNIINAEVGKFYFILPAEHNTPLPQ